MSKIVYNNMIYGAVDDNVLGRPDLAPYVNGVSFLQNFNVNLLGGVSRRKGLRKLFDLDGEARIIDFVYSAELTFLIVLSNKTLRVYNTLLERFEGEIIATPYEDSILSDIQYTQDSSSVYFVHKDYPPYNLSYTGGTFKFSTLSPICDEAYPNLFNSAHNYPSVVAFCSNRLILASSDNNPYRMWVSRAFEPRNFTTYDVYNNTEKTLASYKDYPTYYENWKAEGTNTTYSQSFVKWQTDILKPSTWWKNREETEVNPEIGWEDVLATAPSLWYEIITIDGSGNITKAVSATCAMVLDLGSNKNDRICWIGTNYNIIIGTRSSEWVMSAEINAVSQSVRQVSAFGAIEKQAVAFGSKIIFLQSNGILRSIGYDSQTYSYPCLDKTQFNRSILESGVKEIAVQRVPVSRVFLLLNNGHIAILTKNELTEAEGWSFYDTTIGKFTSLAVLDTLTGQSVYAVVDNSLSKDESEDLKYCVCVFDSSELYDIKTHNYVSKLRTNPIENSTYSTLNNTKYGWCVALRCIDTERFKVGFSNSYKKEGNASKDNIVSVALPTSWQKDMRLEIESIEDKNVNIQAILMNAEVI